MLVVTKPRRLACERMGVMTSLRTSRSCPRIAAFAVTIPSAFVLLIALTGAASAQIPTMACCFSNGTCADMTGLECLGAGGLPQGPATSCATTPCPSFDIGACCFWPNFPICENLTADSCAVRGGYFLGGGTRCETTCCEGPGGSCCFPTGECYYPFNCPITCYLWGGAWDVVQCDFPCEDRYEACCLPDQSCIIETPLTCIDAFGGEPQGPGTNCSAVNCAVNATDSQSWGLLKQIFR